MKTTIFPILLAGAINLTLQGADWPQYRGPNHDGVSPEQIPLKWPASGPRAVWKTPLKNGFSSFTLGGGKAYTIVTRDFDGGDQETCLALDADTGKELWADGLGAGTSKYDGGGDSGTADNKGGDGARSTPTFDDGKIYCYTSQMTLHCLNAADGKQIWTHDIKAEYAGRNIHWESAASPLVEGGLVYVVGGGQGQGLLAFDKKDGHVVWKGQDDGMTQATPVAATILGVRQIVFFTSKGLVAVAPTTGAVLWRYAFPGGGNGSAASSPVVSGDIVYVSKSYGAGSGACKITRSPSADDIGFVATELWRIRNNNLSSHWSTPVAVGGYLYGIFGQAQFGTAPLECVDLGTGEVKWSKPGFGPGGVNLVGGNLLVLSDAGDLVLAKAAPDAYTELDRSHVLTGKCWNSVAISNGRVYARSTKEGVSLDMAGMATN
jgi:outer membrane protein assembly factor BamB